MGPQVKKYFVAFDWIFIHSFCLDSRRLNRKYCVPALLSADHGTKRDELEWFTILNPRDIQAIYFYIDFIRPYGRHPPSTDALLVNSQAQSLSSNCTGYFYLSILAHHEIFHVS